MVVGAAVILMKVDEATLQPWRRCDWRLRWNVGMSHWKPDQWRFECRQRSVLTRQPAVSKRHGGVVIIRPYFPYGVGFWTSILVVMLPQ